MIDALHAYAIAGTGTSPEPVDLAAVLADLDPSVDRPATCRRSPGDRDQIGTVLANLLGNAARLARDGARRPCVGRRDARRRRRPSRSTATRKPHRSEHPAEPGPGDRQRISRPAARVARSTAAGRRGRPADRRRAGRASARARPGPRCSVSGSTSIWLTTVPATSDSSAQTKCGRSIRFIVEQ